MTIHQARPTFNLLAATFWLLANAVGFGLAGAFFHNLPLDFTVPPDPFRLYRFSLMPGLVGAAFGFIPALLIGLWQWLILRRSLPLSRWWIASAPAGMAVMHFVSDGFEHARDLSLAVLAGGLVAAFGQWRLLRRHLPASAWWIPASAGGWLLGWIIGLAVLHYTGVLYLPWSGGLDFRQHGTLGLAAGLAYGLGTGVAFRWLITGPAWAARVFAGR